MTTGVGDRYGATAPAVPARGPRRALLPVGIVAGGLALAVGVQLVFDPFRTDIPLCIVYHLTGLYCPGCGAIRAVHSVLGGDLLLALRSNALITVALPLVALAFVLWTIRRVRGLATDLLPSTRVACVLVALIGVFTVLRNLPAFWFIAPISFIGA